MIRRFFFLILAACIAGAVAYANPDDSSYTRLARLSYLEGNISFQHTSDVDWSSASINMPLEPGDRIYTGPEGRAEIQFDDGSALRLAENTDIEILSLSQDLIQIRMMIGLSTLNLSGDADFEIDTPAAAFNAVRDGVYRFDVIENGDTDAIVRKGELEAANNDFARRIRAGELMHLSPGSAGNPQISQYDRRDAWDEWTDRRSADVRVYGNVRHLPDSVYIGASDLDRYGRWVNVESYGTAWVPYDMVDDWAPYSYGRWCYRPLYGWTWVSYEPWGWLPYHYGSWYRSAIYGWCWLPGPAFSFNFWSPGLVTFYSGPGWISWCPLGPGDYYDVRNYHYNRGIYGHQLALLRRLHSRAEGDLFNRDAHGAFRTARLDQFRDGSFDRSRNSRWDNINRPWAQGTLVRDQLGVQPTSRSYSAVPDRPAAGPRQVNHLPAVVRNVPAARYVGKQERFTRITNPQVTSASPRVFRNRVEGGTDTRDGSRSDTRVIQVPPNSSTRQNSSRPDARNVETPRAQESRGISRANDARGREEPRRGGRQPAAPSGDRQNASPRNERSVPEQRPAPQRNDTGVGGRNDFRQENSQSAARPGIGRWSESNPGGTRYGGSFQIIAPSPSPNRSGGVSAYTLPGAGTQGLWDNSRSVQRSVQPEGVPGRNAAPPSEKGGRWNSSSPSPNSGIMRSEPSRPQTSSRALERGGGSRPSFSQSAPSFGRSAPAGRSSSESRGNRRR